MLHKKFLLLFIVFITSVQINASIFGSDEIEALETQNQLLSQKVTKLENNNKMLLKQNTILNAKQTQLMLENSRLNSLINLNEEQKKTALDSRQNRLEKAFEKKLQLKRQIIMEQNNTIEKLTIKLDEKKYQLDEDFKKENQQKLKENLIKESIPYLLLGIFILMILMWSISNYTFNRRLGKKEDEKKILKNKMEVLISLHQEEKRALENLTQENLQTHKKEVNTLKDEVEKSTKNHIMEYIKELKEKRDRNIGLL